MTDIIADVGVRPVEGTQISRARRGAPVVCAGMIIGNGASRETLVDTMLHRALS